MSDFAEMLAESLGRRDERPEAKILPEARIARLKEAAERYARPNPFKVGDLVTPAAGGTAKGAGNAEVVVAVRQADFDFTQGEIGGTSFGRVHDMRVLSIQGDRIGAFWVESADYEPYQGPPP